MPYPKKKEIIVTIERPYGGWISDDNTTFPKEGNDDQYTNSTGIDLWRSNKKGHICPAHLFTALTDSSGYVTKLPLNACGSSNTTKGFSVLANTRVVRIDIVTPSVDAEYGVGVTVLTGTTTNGSKVVTGLSTTADLIAGASVTGTNIPASTTISSVDSATQVTLNNNATGSGSVSLTFFFTGHSGHDVSAINTKNHDIIAVKDAASTPTEYIAWSWEDGTDADIAIMKNDGSGANGSWFSNLSGSAVLTKGVPHMMALGPDGVLYITNGQYIASANFATVAITSATGNAKALNLGSGFIATSITSWGNYLAILGYKATIGGTSPYRGECRLWVWDTFSPNPNSSYKISDNHSGALYNKDGILYAFTDGRKGVASAWYFTGNEVKFIVSNPYGPLTSPNHGSVDEVFGALFFMQPSGSGVMALDGPGLHQPGQPWTDMSGITDNGFVKDLGSATGYFIGSNVTTSYKILQYNISSYATGVFFYGRLISLPYKCTIKKFRVYFSQLGTGASLLLQLFLDYNSNAASHDKLNYTLTNAALGAVYHTSFEKVIPDVSSFWLQLNFNHALVTNTAAIVRKIEIICEPSDKM